MIADYYGVEEVERKGGGAKRKLNFMHSHVLNIPPPPHTHTHAHLVANKELKLGKC